jgi:subtilisin
VKNARAICACILLLALGAAGLRAAPGNPARPGNLMAGYYAQSAAHRSAVVDRLIARTPPGSRARVILGLDQGFVPAGLLDAPRREAQRQRMATARQNLVASLARGRFAEKRRYRELPFIAIEIASSELAKLKTISGISSIEEDLLSRPTLASSNPVIGSPAAWSAGYDGQSQVIAVLDTGVDSAHPFFATRGNIVAEACFSTTSAAEGGSSNCPGGVATATGPGAAAPCGTADCDHGTHVAGIAAGNDLAGPNFGVARGADLIAVQIFSDFESVTLCGTYNPCSLSYVSDQIAALEHIYSLSNDYNIAAVNLSLGDGAYAGLCDVSEVARKAAIDSLRSVGIATIVASGNDGYNNRMQAPACISSAISVGATRDNDTVASFSNVADFLSLLAPGVSITSSVPGGGTATFNGTSMAAPHVAGAWAALKQQHPGASVDEILAALRTTGEVIDDDRRGAEVTGMRRIELDLALGLTPGGSLPAGLYVPILPCRIVDTRLARLEIAGQSDMHFLAGKIGQELDGQGGAGDSCGVSPSAVAAHVNVTVIANASRGHLRAWPFGAVEPLATLLAWSGASATNALTLPLCTGAQCTRDFTVRMYGAIEGVDLVIDVLGYYEP